MRNEIVRRLEENTRIANTIASSHAGEIESVIKYILAADRAGGKVVLCGNGGSAADAQHIACELLGKVVSNRRPISAMALTTNTSTITALANDYGYDVVFNRQIEAMVDNRDVVIGISTSGNSQNVIEALQTARKKGAKTIGFTGRDGGKLAGVADLLLKIPSDSTPRIQEAHITIGHIICELIEEELAEKD